MRYSPALVLTFSLTLLCALAAPASGQAGGQSGDRAAARTSETAEAAGSGASEATAADAAAANSGTALAALTPDDYGQWERLGRGTLSDNGQWLAVGIRRVNDEEELRIRRIGTDSLIVIPYGDNATFSEDGRWLAYGIGVSEDEREALQKKDEQVRRDLGLLDLATGDTTLIEGVGSFAFSDDGAYLAMRRYRPQGAGEDAGAADLIVRDMATGSDTRFGNVDDFAWQDDGGLLAFIIDAGDDAANGVQLYNPDSNVLRTLISASAEFTGLAWRPASDDLAVLRAKDEEDKAYEDTTHVILAWTGLENDDPETYTFDPAKAAGFPDTMRVVEYRRLNWAEDGGTLFFGMQAREPAEDAGEDADSTETADAAADSAAVTPADSADIAPGDSIDSTSPDSTATPADSASAEGEEEDELDPAQVLVWHADDVPIIPRQEVMSGRDRRDNYLAAWHLGSGDFVQLGTELTEDARVLEGDRLAMGMDETPYLEERMFGPSYEDVYLIDVESGERDRVIQKVQYFFGASDGGRYLLYLMDDHYWSYDVESGERTNLTEGLPTSFVDVDDDHTVEQKPPFGYADWTGGDEAVLLYDEYDIWRISPDGSDAERLTNGAADSVRYRYVDLEFNEAPENDWIDPDETLYMRIYDEWSEQRGYARMEMGDSPERLVWLEKATGWLRKADEADVYTYRIQDFNDSPDIFVAGADLADREQITETNPFQSEYAWGRSELVAYENANGVPLQGALFYPANYQAGKQYPMIVYIYEIRSPSVRRYVTPTVEHPYNTTVFTSEGYFVFQPDIVYRPRNPGLSAVEAIVPAVEKVLETGMIDPDRVGLVGHSWGGYQTVFTVTQTDIFAAAVGGAPLTNLVSMYNSIYWRSGGTDARIFEISQGRMEVPPWEDWESYFNNSPLHNIEGMHTPLLVAAGTDDGAVEFNQAVEFYNAARRADKEFVLLVYDGENHGISRREEDSIDYRWRVLTWFDHYLKGEPAPKWITEGVPYLEQMEMREDGAQLPGRDRAEEDDSVT